MQKVLIIDNNDSFTFNLVQIIEQSGLCSFEVCKNNSVLLKAAQSFDKFLLSPGPGIPSDFPIMYDIIKNYGDKKSILGICLGHQAIAESFGGQLERMDTVAHGFSKKINLTGTDYLFAGLPKQIEVGLYHSWIVSEKNFPDEMIITAKSEDGIIMAAAHKRLNIRGLQFHPESIMTPLGKQILSNWLRY